MVKRNFRRGEEVVDWLVSVFHVKEAARKPIGASSESERVEAGWTLLLFGVRKVSSNSVCGIVRQDNLEVSNCERAVFRKAFILSRDTFAVVGT